MNKNCKCVTCKCKKKRPIRQQQGTYTRIVKNKKKYLRKSKHERQKLERETQS